MIQNEVWGCCPAAIPCISSEFDPQNPYPCVLHRRVTPATLGQAGAGDGFIPLKSPSPVSLEVARLWKWCFWHTSGPILSLNIFSSLEDQGGQKTKVSILGFLSPPLGVAGSFLIWPHPGCCNRMCVKKSNLRLQTRNKAYGDAQEIKPMARRNIWRVFFLPKSHRSIMPAPHWCLLSK